MAGAPSFASSPAVRARMQAQRTRDTGPETALRRELHARGLRFRVHRPVPGAPRRSVDIAFGPARVAVLVHGCHWHGCPDHSRPPVTNADYWGPKIERNRERDAETEALLATAGWLPLVVWEHERPADAADRVERAVLGRRPARTGPDGDRAPSGLRGLPAGRV